MTVPVEVRREQKRRCEEKRYHSRTQDKIEKDKAYRKLRKEIENKRNRIYYEQHREEINRQRKSQYAKMRKEDPDGLRFLKWKAEIKSQYGISPDDFTAMLTSQGSRCAICGDDKNGGKKWHIDHCHKSNKVRGILCGHCNKMLGLAKDSPEILVQAAKYLQRFNMKEER